MYVPAEKRRQTIEINIKFLTILLLILEFVLVLMQTLWVSTVIVYFILVVC